MKYLILTCFIWLSLGCKLPAYEVEKEADLFKENNPQAFATYKIKTQNIYYAKYGNSKKQPVIFVHGSPGSWRGWVRFLTDPELNQNFYLIAVDRPGFGESDLGKSEPSIEKQAEAIFQVIELEKLTNPILVGHSLGGPVIARMAMDHPDRFEGLVFVAASVSPVLEETKWFQYPANWFGIKQIIPTELRVCNEEILALKENLTEMLPLWSNIKSPTIIIHGEKDDLVPIANKDFLIEKLNQKTVKQVVVDPDLNHFIPWKKSVLIKQAILDLTKK